MTWGSERMNEESLFAAALDKPTAVARRAFLDEACAGDVRLRQRVEQRLPAEDACGILDRGQNAAARMGVYQSEPPPPVHQGFPRLFVLRQKLGGGSLGA